MDEVDINDWLTFATIVEEQGFTAAAKKLGLSPSVLSKRITRLESTLNARLLQRTTRHLTLTDIGQSFYERCSRLRAEIEDAMLVVSNSQGTPQGKLRINAPMSFGHQHLVSAASDFIKQYPTVQIELILGSHYSNLIEGGLDVAIHIKDLPDSSLHAKRIALRSTKVYGSPEYFARHSLPIVPDDLRHHNCLLYQLQPTKHEWRFYHEGTEFIVPVSGNFKANSSQALAAAAVSGIGIVKLPGYMVTQEIIEGKLQSVLNEYAPKDIGIYAVYQHNKHLAPKIRAFLDFIAQRFGTEHYWNEE